MVPKARAWSKAAHPSSHCDEWKGHGRSRYSRPGPSAIPPTTATWNRRAGLLLPVPAAAPAEVVKEDHGADDDRRREGWQGLDRVVVSEEEGHLRRGRPSRESRWRAQASATSSASATTPT